MTATLWIVMVIHDVIAVSVMISMWRWDRKFTWSPIIYGALWLPIVFVYGPIRLLLDWAIENDIEAQRVSEDRDEV